MAIAGLLDHPHLGDDLNLSALGAQLGTTLRLN
jgi:hypothetical protein